MPDTWHEYIYTQVLFDSEKGLVKHVNHNSWPSMIWVISQTNEMSVYATTQTMIGVYYY